jgi:hypothetical protein
MNSVPQGLKEVCGNRKETFFASTSGQGIPTVLWRGQISELGAQPTQAKKGLNGPPSGIEGQKSVFHASMATGSTVVSAKAGRVSDGRMLAMEA